MIEIKGLVKRYGAHEVLKGINLDVNEGEIYGFIGHNGAGKSTTMMILAGLIGFDEGRCLIDGIAVAANEKGQSFSGNLSVQGPLFKRLGYLPEEPRFYPYMSAWEYLELVGTSGGLTKHEVKRRSGEVLSSVKLTKDARRAIGLYSRGMKQRLGMAVAMFHDPKVLLLDEPSSALDPAGRQDVVEIIESLKARGKTIFLSTHILNDIERVCDRIGILHGGRVVIEDRLESVLKSYVEPIYDISLRVEGGMPGKGETLSKDETLETSQKLEVSIALEASNRLEKALGELHFVQKTWRENGLLSVSVRDVKTDGEGLLRCLAPFGGLIDGVVVRRTSLESIYMKVVNGDAS